ncbi:hypothetical protein BS47DRAFT_1305859 [Hydnum rufescens UP504]|uniref:FHF complex subunit HOOK-interacting protein C-terminal domain-containing protein n=1 Tax=Hydnum rufescens UP504 TaxID=1448309 RepID=A0A9P6DK80_9AGAM|nr:hypothetical protein BS47DRAFT_1305859 [Hydnum rufescens UP504]
MSYFAQFLRPSNLSQSRVVDPVAEFDRSWWAVKNTLLYPDERQLARGISSTNVVEHLQSMVSHLVREASSLEEDTTGVCLEYLLKNDVLGTLVRFSENDRPFGVQAEVLRMIIKLVTALDEQFLVHSAVHRAVIRLLRTCVGDEIEEPVDGRRPMGAASASVPAEPSDYEFELVDLLCTLCTRIRSYPDLLLIFLHDKNWYPTIPLSTILDDDEDEEEIKAPPVGEVSVPRIPSPTPSSTSTITSAPSGAVRKPEYEFLIFNYLLRFVHREGKIGDLGRGGILSLVDVAMTAGESSDHATSDPSSSSDPVGEAALALAEYILDGDFSEVLCAGLGAVYSALPTKLEVRRKISEQSGGMALGGLTEEERAEHDAKDAESAQRVGLVFSTDIDFRAHLEHFLKLLEFLQDLLLRICASDDGLQKPFPPSALVGIAITQGILDTFRTTFLQNVLYPSILECSEVDGSAVAVMTYIDEMLHTVSEPSIADLIVTFLMSEEDDPQHPRPQHKIPERLLDGRKMKRVKKVRRKSSAMILLEYEAAKNSEPDYFNSLGRFTLKDLIISNLRSQTQPSATAALRLLRSIFTDHCHLTIDGLLTVARDPQATSFPAPRLLYRPHIPAPRSHSPVLDDEEDFVYPGAKEHALPPQIPPPDLFAQPETTLDDHAREVDLYLNLVSRIVPSHGANDDNPFSTGYDNYIRDAIMLIQDQSCFVEDNDSILSMPQHRLLPTDPLLSTLLQSLRLFFSHTPEHNVALTGVLSAISACPHRSISGWLTMVAIPGDEVDWPEESPMEDDDSDGDDRSIDFKIDELLRSGVKPVSRRRRNDSRAMPVLYVVISGLVSQLDRYRGSVEDFDRFLEERRQGLLFKENINDALNLHFELAADAAAAPPPNTPAKVPPSTPVLKAKSTIASVTAYFTPTKSAKKAVAPVTPNTKANVPPTPGGRPKVFPASPFTPHYTQTGAIEVQPYVAPAPTSGPWSPTPKAGMAMEEGDVFSAPARRGSVDMSSDDGRRTNAGLDLKAAARVSLSQLLDNVVILEESIKELAAILQVRRSLGIDAIRYI